MNAPSDELENGVGYLLYSDEVTDYTIGGLALDSYTVTINPGWNLIGSIYSAVDFRSPATDPESAIEPGTVYWFDCLGYVASDSLQPGRGYLILANQTATLTVPGVGKTVVPILKAKKSNVDWIGKVKVNSGESYKAELSFGVAKEATDDYDVSFDSAVLPPIPGENSAYLDNALVKSVHSPDQLSWDITLMGSSAFELSIEGLPENYIAELFDARGKEVPLNGLVAGRYKLLVHSTLPVSYELRQNFPNPFNLNTTIVYGLPNNSKVNLSVYNLLGGKVATLVNEDQNAGYKKVCWDGRDNNGNVVSTGVYFYKLEAGSRTLTQKMLLVK